MISKCLQNPRIAFKTILCIYQSIQIEFSNSTIIQLHEIDTNTTINYNSNLCIYRVVLIINWLSPRDVSVKCTEIYFCLGKISALLRWWRCDAVCFAIFRCCNRKFPQLCAKIICNAFVKLRGLRTIYYIVDCLPVKYNCITGT